MGPGSAAYCPGKPPLSTRTFVTPIHSVILRRLRTDTSGKRRKPCDLVPPLDFTKPRAYITRMLNRLTIACASLFAAALVSAPAAADANRFDITLEYEAYFGGFHVASARTQIDRRSDAYLVEAAARARGMLDWYSGWRGVAASKGRLGPEGTVQPDRHNNEGVWDGGTRMRSLDFRPDGTVEVQLVEEDDDDDDDDAVTSVPPESIPGSVDPISAILSLAELMRRGGTCDGTIPVYDGKRRYDLTVRQDGSRTFSPNSYTIFSGEAVACRVDFDRIGGFRIERSKYSRTARERIVWVGQPFEDAPPIPVRVDVETAYGNLVIHLTAARLGGEEIALEPGTDNLAD